ncbi:MAG: hypothetical protein U0575_15575 [Phycisphaerales bacterium]
MIVLAGSALLLGALTTIAVAFGCAWLERGISATAREATRYPEPPNCGMRIKRIEMATGFDIQAQTGTIVENIKSPNSDPGDVDRLVPEWARPPLVPWGWQGGWQIGQWSYRRLAARGWPMAAMWSAAEARSATHSGFGSWVVIEGIALDPPPPPGVFSATIPRAIPTRPIVAGFAVDTVVYVVAWLALLFALGAARRTLQRHRNRCVACGYDRRATARDAPCPECGARNLVA